METISTSDLSPDVITLSDLAPGDVTSEILRCVDMESCTPDPSTREVVTLDPDSLEVLEQTSADLDSAVRKFSEQEYRLGRRAYFSNINSWPRYLEQEVVTEPEVPLHQFEVPMGRKCYVPIARGDIARCCGGAGLKFRCRQCGYLSKSRRF